MRACILDISHKEYLKIKNAKASSEKGWKECMNSWGISKGNYKKKSKSQMEMLKMKKLDLRDEKLLGWAHQPTGHNKGTNQ